MDCYNNLYKYFSIFIMFYFYLIRGKISMRRRIEGNHI